MREGGQIQRKSEEGGRGGGEGGMKRENETHTEREEGRRSKGRVCRFVGGKWDVSC